MADRNSFGLGRSWGGAFASPRSATTNLECNPRRTSDSQLELLHGAGFKGLSFGVQDINPSVQRAIGRINSLELVRDVCSNARDAGFETISLDLIYGLPEQTEASFLQTLEEVVDLGPDRVRCYSCQATPGIDPRAT